MHNYNATLVHWHHTLGCQCSSFGTYAVHKVVPVTVLISDKFYYFMNTLWGKNEVEVKFETACTTTMPPYFIDITHWDVSAVVLVLMLFTKWGPSNNQNLTDGQTEENRQSNSQVGYRIINIILKYSLNDPLFPSLKLRFSGAFLPKLLW